MSGSPLFDIADPLAAHHVEMLAAFRDKRPPDFRSRVSTDMPDMTDWWPEGRN